MKHFAINTVSLTLARGLSFGGRAFALLLLAERAAPGELAAATIAVTLAETARAVGDLGLEVWLVRTVGLTADGGSRRRAANAALTLRLIGGALAALAVWVIAREAAGLAPVLAGAAAALAITGLAVGVPVAALQGRMQLSRLMRSLVPILALGLAVMVMAAHAGAGAAVLLFVLAAFECAAVGATARQAEIAAPWRSRLPWRELGALLRECVPTAVFNALVGVYSRLDVWLLAAAGGAALSTYTVAFRMYQPASLLLGAIAGVAYARMARALGPGGPPRDGQSPGAPPPGARRRVTLPVLVAGVAGAVALVAGFDGLGVWALDHPFARYADAEPVLLTLGFLLPVAGVNGLLTAVLAARGRFVVLCRLAAFNLVVFTVALRALIPAYGATGAAMALLIGESCNLGVQSWLVRASHDAQPRPGR
jgi:O-antigen/teichoic acid export membrane protein